MKTITLKTNLQRYLVLILFMCLGFSNLYSQDNSCITLANCPSDIAVCADTYAIPGDTSSPYGANVIWNTPDVSQTCSNNSTGGNFNMLFELNEQLLSQDCWNFNYISRVGTGGGYVKLFSGNDGDKDEKSKIITPYLILEDDTNVTIDLVYDQGNYNVQLFLDGGIDNLGNPYPNKALNTYTVTGAQTTYSWAVNFDPGNGAVTGITGIYSLRFVFTYTGAKPTNANTGDTIIAIEGFLNEDGCKAGIDFTVTGPNQGFYPVGVHNLQYIATYTAPDGSVITKSCSFTITVVGLEVTATGTDVSCSGETDGQIRVQGSGAINDGNSASTYKLFDSNDVKIGEFSYPLTTNPNTVYTFTPENTNNPIGAGTYTIEFDQVINGGTTCQATTTVTIGTDPDTTPPAFSSCPTDISVNNDTGECGALVTWTQPVAGDNCEIASLTSNFNSGDTFPVGTTTVTYTATDGAGLTTDCSFDVIVTDNEAPIITCPDDINLNVDAGNCSAVATFATPTGADNCSVASVTQTAGPTTGSAFPVGSTTVTFQVTDTAGLTADCSFNVIVTDNETPTITCPGDIVVSNDADSCDAVVNYTTPVGTDNCPGANTALTAGLASGSTFPLGDTIVTYEVTDAAGNKAECSFTVTVNDTQLPEITCPGDIVVSNDADSCDAVVNYTTPVGTDNCPGANTVLTAGLASGSAFPIGTTLVTYQVTDAAGKTAQCSFNVIVNDTQDPIITCPGDIVVSNDADSCDAVVNYTTPVGTDNCPGANTVLTAGLASGSTFPIGTTLVTYQVTDAAGRTAECSFNVTVNDTQDPIITCPGDIVVSNDANSCDAVVNYTTPVGTDNCPGANTVLTAGLASGSAFPIGTTLVTYQVTDAAGRTAECSFNVTVNDTQDPIITCPGDVTANTSDDGEGNCSTTVLLGSPVANDNCGVKSIVAQVGGVDIDPTTFEFDLGETLVTWIVTDDSDRTASCNQTVTIIDDESPRFDAPPTVTITCNDDPDDLTLTGTVRRYNIDNCDSTPLDPVYSDSTAPGTCPIITVITRTWTIYDLTGNFHTHTQTINVVPDTLVISDVPNETVTVGTYSTQEDLDTAFAAWLNNFSVSGGCSPSGDFAEQYTAPALCGGSVDIVYNVTDLCQTGQDIATFTVESANPLITSDVQDLTVNACDFTDQAALDTAFANWIAGFSVTGGNSPTGEFAEQYSVPVLCDGGATSVTYNVTDLCESGQDTATFTVTPADALVISDVQD
ncbi:MAG TPA: HYR domain-containing protein, partial [Yeosuana sp.]